MGSITDWKKELKGFGRKELNKGERYAADDPDKIEQIPGSKAYIIQSGKHSKDYGALLSLDTKTNQGVSKIDEILSKENAGAFNSHFGGLHSYVTRELPGKTQDVGAKMDSLKSDLKLAGLEVIRQGGSVGQMTEKEWPIVEAMIDKLKPRMGEKAARDAYENIKTYLMEIASNGKTTYDAEWGETQYHKGKTSVIKEADAILNGS